MKKSLIALYKKDTVDALSTLHHSWNKLKDQKLPSIVNKNLDEFESWEALASRFARTTDIFLSKYLRSAILDQDPGFRGEMRDLIDKAEKLNIVSNADQWMQIRELRNKIAHEYTKEDILKTLSAVIKLTPFVLDELKELNN